MPFCFWGAAPAPGTPTLCRKELFPLLPPPQSLAHIRILCSHTRLTQGQGPCSQHLGMKSVPITTPVSSAVSPLTSKALMSGFSRAADSWVRTCPGSCLPHCPSSGLLTRAGGSGTGADMADALGHCRGLCADQNLCEVLVWHRGSPQCTVLCQAAVGPLCGDVDTSHLSLLSPPPPSPCLPSKPVTDLTPCPCHPELLEDPNRPAHVAPLPCTSFRPTIGTQPLAKGLPWPPLPLGARWGSPYVGLVSNKNRYILVY